MTFSRAVPLVLVLAVLPVWPAAAQFGGMPGMPGSPGGAPGGFGAAPQQPPAACQQLITLRDETQKHGQALQAASQKKASAEELCKLFKVFLGAETKMLRGLEEQSTTCGVPAEVLQQVRSGHSRASQTSKQICEVAAQGPRPSGPSLSDALGTTPVVPDTNSVKKGQGTFDTLSGSPLAR
jgi:hypothetical protein